MNEIAIGIIQAQFVWVLTCVAVVSTVAMIIKIAIALRHWFDKKQREMRDDGQDN